MEACTLLIYYHRPDSCYDDWKLWVWENAGPEASDALLPQLVQPAFLNWTQQAASSLEERGMHFSRQPVPTALAVPGSKGAASNWAPRGSPVDHWYGRLFRVDVPHTSRQQRVLGVLPVKAREPYQEFEAKDAGGDRLLHLSSAQVGDRSLPRIFYLHQDLADVADNPAVFGLSEDVAHIYVRRVPSQRRTCSLGLRLRWTSVQGNVTERVVSPDCGCSPYGCLAPWSAAFGQRFTLPRFLFQYWMTAALSLELVTGNSTVMLTVGETEGSAGAGLTWPSPLTTASECPRAYFAVEDSPGLFTSVESVTMLGEAGTPRFLRIGIHGLDAPFPVAIFDDALTSFAEIPADAFRDGWSLYILDRQAYGRSRRLGLAVVDPLLDEPLPTPQFWLEPEPAMECAVAFEYAEGSLRLSPASFWTLFSQRRSVDEHQNTRPGYARGATLACRENVLRSLTDTLGLCSSEVHCFRGIEQTHWALCRLPKSPPMEQLSVGQASSMLAVLHSEQGASNRGLHLFAPRWGAPYFFPAEQSVFYVWYRRYSRDHWLQWRLWILTDNVPRYSSPVISWEHATDRALFVALVPPAIQGTAVALLLSRDDQLPPSIAEHLEASVEEVFDPSALNWDLQRIWYPNAAEREVFLFQGREQVFHQADLVDVEPRWLQEQYLEIAYLRPRGDYEAWHLWLWDADFAASTGREVASAARAPIDEQHPHVEALIFRIDRGWFGPAKRLGFLAKKRGEHGVWADRDGPDRFWTLSPQTTRVCFLQGREELALSIEDFVLEVTPFFEDDLLELCFPFPPWWKHSASVTAAAERDGSALATTPRLDAVARDAPRGDAPPEEHFLWHGRAPTREPRLYRRTAPGAPNRILGDDVDVNDDDDDIIEALELTLYWQALPNRPDGGHGASAVSHELCVRSTHQASLLAITADDAAGVTSAVLSASECTASAMQTNPADPWRSDTTTGCSVSASASASIESGTTRYALPHIVRMRSCSDPLKLQFQLDRTLDEDFPVEEVMVHLKGFSPSRGAWRRYENVDDYYYSGALGWHYTKSATTFRVFAPTADLVVLCLYREPVGTVGRQAFPMRRIPQGVWKIVVHGDLQGLYYTYLAEGVNKRLFPGVEVIDPYSRCNTAHNGRGLIFGEDHTEVADRPCIPPEHTIIYEVHLRDFTIDECSGVPEKLRGKYLGLAQQGTQLPEHWVRSRIVSSAGRAALFLRDRATPDAFEEDVCPSTVEEDVYTAPVLTEVAAQVDWTDRSTCLDHVRFLGVNALQIMPVQDFDNDESNPLEYRWGYMPVHFFSPDGWYASCTSDASRVRELKQLIDTLHRAGLKVILDMVLNHTAEDPNEFNLEARFSFNGLAPRYYYRFWPDGSWGVSEACYANGSGCGNEFRSESPMGRKFILDMLWYWATEYKVDGFRFDLMGLMDRETLRIAAAKLHALDPNILVYGEPWSAGETPIIITGKGAQRHLGFGVFNDTFRNALRGSNQGIEENFLLDGGCIEAVKQGILGSIDDFAASPLEVINYVECHDNRTLWDHLWYVIRERADANITYTAADVLRVCKLAAVILLTSQGIPFLHSGQEMARSKFGVENSYQSGDDINRLRWERKIDFYGLVVYVRGLVQLRRARPDIFSMSDAQQVRRCIAFYEALGLPVPERCLAYRIIADAGQSETNAIEDDPWRCVALLFNPTPVAQVFPLPPEAKDELMTVIVNDLEAPRDAGASLGEYHIGWASVPGRSAMVLRLCTESERERALIETRLNAISEPYSSTTDLPGLYSSYATPGGSKTSSPAPVAE